MTARQLWFSFVAVLGICMVIVLGAMTSSIRSPQTAAQQTQTTTETQPQIAYVLRAWNGHMGLFRGDCETPYQELDMPLMLLSEYDRNMVEQGISVDTEEELRQLVEDLTS